jgi:hypothetical protein
MWRRGEPFARLVLTRAARVAPLCPSRVVGYLIMLAWFRDHGEGHWTM